jgi:hypothetical protein
MNCECIIMDLFEILKAKIQKFSDYSPSNFVVSVRVSINGSTSDPHTIQSTTLCRFEISTVQFFN